MQLGETIAEFSVRNETDSAVSGTWDEDDEQFDPKRRIILFPFEKWSEVVSTVKSFLS